MAVGPLLLRHERHVRHTRAAQDLRHALPPRAVERRIDHTQPGRIAAPHTARLHRVQIGLQAILADHLDPTVCERGGKIAEPHPVKGIDRRDLPLYGRRGLERDLTAVRPVNLIAVVGSGIVAGRDAHARAAAVVTHRPAQRGGRLKARVKIRAHTVGSKHARRLACKERRTDAAVVGHRAAQRQSSGAQISGKPLCHAAHHIDVHASRARPEHAAQPSRAKGQITGKTVFDLLHVGCLVQREKLRAQRVILHAREPETIAFQSGHSALLLWGIFLLY